jgi:arylsulfatase A-like enzyme
MPITVAPEGATAMTKSFPESYRWWTVDFPEDQQRLAIQGYYAAATMMDEIVVRAVDFLEKEGHRDNTIIVFVADHGYNLGYRHNWTKHILYPSILRIPLIIRDPGMNNKNVRVKGLVELQDIFPTLSELAGLPAPKGIYGVSAVKLMENPDGKGKRAVFAQGILHEGNGMVVTTENGTYLEWDKGKYREYYDISKDPDAWYNLVGNP